MLEIQILRSNMGNYEIHMLSCPTFRFISRSLNIKSKQKVYPNLNRANLIETELDYKQQDRKHENISALESV